MDRKPCTTILFFLFLLIATPYFIRGGWMLGSDVYEIDYRGPETHSSIPSPGHSLGKSMTRRESTSSPVKCKDSRGCNRVGNGKTKKIHG